MKLLSPLLLFGCWLEVKFDVVASLFNAALYKPAWQSSVFFDRIANLGNDGNTQLWINSTFVVAETYQDNPAWWMVDLTGQFVTEQIVLTNRGDLINCAHRLRNFQIDVFKTDPRKLKNFLNVSGDVCFNRTDPVDGGTFTWNCTTPVTGRYVRLIRYGKDYFNVVEVQVRASRELLTFTSFTRRIDSVLANPFIVSVNASSLKECVQRCLKLRSGSRCTAFNWMISTAECQLFSIDARKKKTILSRLTSSQNVSFYMESN